MTILMNNFFSQLKQVKLSRQENVRIRASLERTLGYAPPKLESLPIQPSPYVSHFSFFSKKMIAFALVVMVISGTGLSYAAELSLPGDALYPVKLNWNEAIKGTFVYGNTAEAYWNETLVERRLKEINTLRSENKLTKERAAIAEKAFVAQSNQLVASIKKLKQEGNHEVAHTVAKKIIPELENYAKTSTSLATTSPEKAPVALMKTQEPESVSTLSILSATSTPSTLDGMGGSEDIEVPENDTFTKTSEGQDASFEIELEKTTIENKLAEKISAQAKVLASESAQTIPADNNKTTIDDTTGTPATSTVPLPEENEKPVGILVGKVEIGPLCTKDATPKCISSSDAYKNYPLKLYASDSTVAADIILDKDGMFTATIPVGDYTLDMKKQPEGSTKDLPAKITITEDKKSEVKIKITLTQTNQSR